MDLGRLQRHAAGGAGFIGSLNRWLFHCQQLPGQLEQLCGGQAAVALTAGLQQGVVDARPQADRGRGFDTEARGDGIGGAEADAADVAGQAVGVLRHHLHGVVPIRLEDPHRPGGTDAMAVQKHHDLAHHLLISPGLGNAAGPHLADPRHLPQALRRLLDHLEHLSAKGAHQLAGVDRADAADHPRAQVFLDALGGGGGGGAQEGRLELLAVLPVVHPDTRDGDPFARADLGGMAHHRHQVPVAAGLDAQYAEAVAGVVEGDPLDRAGQHLGGLGCGVRHPAGPASDRLVHASSRCHRAMLTAPCNVLLGC